MSSLPSLESFDFQPRTRIVFGEGSLESLGSLAREQGAKRVLLVSDPGVVQAGHAGRALRSLEAAGLSARLFDGVVENPTDRCVAAGFEAARALGADAIVGVGGGSAMDGAKGVGILLSSGGSLADYRGVGKLTRPLPPLIAAPTTAGTGSEVQSAALISDTASGRKMVIWDHRLAPRAALLDPSLTLTLPQAVTAATGIDAISHAVESYVSTRASELSRGFAREAFRLLLPAFERVIRAPGDLRSRGEMLLGASLAGLSIEHSMLGAAHSCANPLTARYGITHGVAVGLLLPGVVRYNGVWEAIEARYAELVHAAGPEALDGAGLRAGPRPGPREGPGEEPKDRGAAARLAAHLETLLEKARLPSRLRDCGVEMERLKEMSDEAEGQWTAAFNPRPVRAGDLEEIYRCAF